MSQHHVAGDPIEDPTVTVPALSDSRLRDYVDLRDVELRTSLEAEHGLFLAEGEKVIRRAVAAGYPVRSFLMAPRWVEGLRAEIVASRAPCYVLPAEDIERLTGFHVHRGALASLARTPLPTVADILERASARSGRVVVLEDVVDHTNIGAIFRSAAAFGVDGVLLSPRCADPLYRRSIKVAMGAVFGLPYARMTEWYDGLAELAAAGYVRLALTPASDAVPLAEAVAGLAHGPAALLLGTEGAGLSRRWVEQADVRVQIPISPDVDSLNVGAATAVACYELASTQSPHSPPPGTR